MFSLIIVISDSHKMRAADEKYSNFHISTIILPDYQHSYTIISEIAFLNLAELPSLIMKVSSLPGLGLELPGELEV